MKILTIDVTDKNLVVAAFDGENISSRVSHEMGKKHNALVMPYIEEVLNNLKLSVNDIDVFSCVVGPGSFTGIRIGIATIKALSFATKKPCVSILALEELAYNVDYECYCAIDALHDNYYVAHFNKSLESMDNLSCLHISEIEKYNLPIIFKNSESDPITLINITIDKAEKGLFSILEPVYLRKSQAERDKDGD